MNKTFSFAGVSTLDGVIKLRVANDSMRVKVLAKNGHSNIDIIELKTPLTKEDAVAYLLSINFDNGNTAIREALVADSEKRVVKDGNRDAPKKETKKPKKPKTSPSLDAISARGIAAQNAKSTLNRDEIVAQLAAVENTAY